MGFGAALLSPLADRIGRRKHVLISLVFIVIGMVASGLAPGFESFLVFRFFAGLFLGGIVPSVNVLVAEYASDRRRGTVMGVYGIGFPLGAALGGFLSIWLIGQWSWQDIARTARQSVGTDRWGQRREFVGLVEQARKLASPDGVAAQVSE